LKLFPKELRVRVGGIIVIEGKLLLIAHKKDNQVYWLLPGGGVDYGESAGEALVREFKEELNIDISVHDLALVCDSIDPDGKRHILNLCFNCSLDGGDLSLGNDLRLHDFSFFPQEDIIHTKIYPPINKNLVSIINNNNEELYVGRVWLNS